MSNAIATQDQTANVPAVAGSFYDEILKPSKKYLKSMKLYTKGKAIDQGLIPPGRYGFYISKEEIGDLGNNIDVLVLERRPCAIDWSNKAKIIRLFDDTDPEFVRIWNASKNKDSNCQCGTSLLIFERATADYYDWFCYSESTKRAARELFAFMPLDEAGAALANEKAKAKGSNEIVSAHPAIPVNLKIKLSTGQYSYHYPLISRAGAPFTNLPTDDLVAAEIAKFKNPKADSGELVQDGDFGGRDR
jgi:hypothetical protein